jgi:hypothetical protein
MDINSISNKMKRSEVVAKFKIDSKKAKKERQKHRAMVAAEMGDAAPAKEVCLPGSTRHYAAHVFKSAMYADA